MDAKEHGEDLKIAITVGVHPAVSIAGAYQAEWGKDEIDIANSLLGGKLTLAKLPYSGLNVPSGAEIVLEGKILVIKLILNGWWKCFKHMIIKEINLFLN